MSAIDSREVQIPAEWREAVCRILLTHDKHLIDSIPQADRDWHSTYPNAWDSERDDALAAALSNDGVTGLHITDMIPPCDAYAFWFSFQEDRLYGKVGLTPDGRIVIIFSSHRPRRGDARL